MNVDEREQLLDYIISLYLPIDRDALLGYYKSYEDMVISINSNTGSEYDVKETFDPESHQDFAQMLEITQQSSFASDVRSIILAPVALKWQIADKLMAEGKSLQGAFSAIRTEATKRRGGSNCVCIPPNEAQKIIEDYYGITEADKQSGQRPHRRNRPSRVDVLSQI